jgi:hypothetical protein
MSLTPAARGDRSRGLRDEPEAAIRSRLEDARAVRDQHLTSDLRRELRRRQFGHDRCRRCGCTPARP